MSTDNGPLYNVKLWCPLGLYIDPEDPHARYGCACPGVCLRRVRAPQRFVLFHILAMDLAMIAADRDL